MPPTPTDSDEEIIKKIMEKHFGDRGFDKSEYGKAVSTDFYDDVSDALKEALNLKGLAQRREDMEVVETQDKSWWEKDWNKDLHMPMFSTLSFVLKLNNDEWIELIKLIREKIHKNNEDIKSALQQKVDEK